MEREGTKAFRPAPLSETPRSEGPKKYIRNVEAEASSPFTSTKGLGHRPKVGSREGREAPRVLRESS
jgi:hypothetical protein